MEREKLKSSKLLGLSKLKDKLLKLSPLYNRKIRFYISKRLAWDLTELFAENNPKLVNNFSSSILNFLINSGEKKESFSFNLEPFFPPLTPEEILKFQKKIIHLQKKNLAVEQEKGYKVLFLGTIFVRGYFYSNKNILRLVNAPLFLLPCNLEKIKNLSLVVESERKINYSLLYYLQKELGLAKEKFTDFLSKLENSNREEITNWENYLPFLFQEFQNLLSINRIKIKLLPAISSLIEKEENREPNTSLFVEPEIINDSEINSESNFDKFFKMDEKKPSINFTGKIIECKKKFVKEGKNIGKNYYCLLVEHNDDRYINPKRLFVFRNLLRDKSIWQLLTSKEEFLDKFYVFYCWSNSPLGFKLSFWEKSESNLGEKAQKSNLISQITGKEDKRFQQKENHFQPEPFRKLTLSNKPKNYPENQLEIVGNFCLTIDDEPSLSLFRDFEKIIEEYSQDKEINWSRSALNLLRGEVESVLTYPKPKESNQPVKPLYVPFASDPSQTRILKVIFQHFSENALCIDGPPGTGKSQLICNLLANALFYQKKVLVICEKEVALKVIYDKLSQIGLNGSMIKINELANTPYIYQDILSHLEKNQQERTVLYDYLIDAKQISNLEEKQASNLRKIANYCRVENEFRTNHQISLQEVYLKFDRKRQLSSTLIQLNQWVKNKEQLDKLKSDLENYLGKFNKIFTSWKSICLQLKNLFLNNSWGFEFNEDNRNNFQQIVSNILKELEGKKTEINLLTKIWRINFFQEHSQIHKSPALLEIKLKELEELRAENNYQIFFAFLQITSFADFWQKCGDKEFLLAIHQFISEEFLIMGELHFALTKSKENIKKNIDYLLRKILVDQEFNYLDSYKENAEQSVYFNWIKEVEEENKEILSNWNQDELIRIQHEQGEIAKKKNILIKIALKNKQKENLNRLFTNQLLKKELSRKRRIASLKKLFPLLVDYFPIWLATPKVIASITDLQRPYFDFLVFDEASQMPLEKAIPLWARAKKCIVIGDEQQLPPTDFFKSHLETDEEVWEQEEEEEEKLTTETEKNLNLEIDDLEKNSNLLGYAKKHARNREKLTLLYHYRSKYPELIEFSNQAFYHGILQIVSASELRKKDYLPIEYRYQPEGRWINTENQVEARYIIDLLKTLPSDKEIGVITFNVKQRDLISDMIEERHNYKNLFVKNLEEVQGDERDIIIFSTGYGPNEEGKIRLNFGPLSSEGGEKRLNVAISRAREKIIIITSLLPDDLNRITEEDENRKLGPKLFKKYLEYAYYCGKNEPEKVQSILEKLLPKITNSSLYEKTEEREEFGSLFEEQLYNELVKEIGNYEIHTQVKSIGYRIDLAVWDDKTQQYILGIECDGEYWHGKLENIERDIYRQQLLEKKGWKIIRILSRDWCRNKEQEIIKIKKELQLV